MMPEPTNRRQASTRETRRLLVTAARALFDEQGYATTTTRQIAERAGVASGTVFKHFPDKESLLIGVLHDELDGVVARSWATLPEGPLLDQLVHLARGVYTLYATNPPLYRALVQATTGSTSPAGIEAQRQVMWYLGDLGRLFEKARERGEVRQDADLLMLPMWYFSQYFLVALHGLSMPSFDPELQASALRNLLLASWDGVSPRPAGGVP
jgi:AcrR family transcriptional regulator